MMCAMTFRGVSILALSLIAVWFPRRFSVITVLVRIRQWGTSCHGSDKYDDRAGFVPVFSTFPIFSFAFSFQPNLPTYLPIFFFTSLLHFSDSTESILNSLQNQCTIPERHDCFRIQIFTFFWLCNEKITTQNDGSYSRSGGACSICRVPR